MASSATDGVESNGQSAIRQIMSEEYLCKVLTDMHVMLQNIKGWERGLFDEYDEFIIDVENFKASLLRFVVHAKIHLNFLKNLFTKPKYQQNNENAKVQLIKDVMGKIDRDQLINYLLACQKMITTSIKLHSKYGSKIFKLKFVLFKALNFATIGAVVGAAVGLALPFVAPLEAFSGALFGGAFGLVVGLVDVFFNWKKNLEEIEMVRTNLVKIQGALENVIQQFRSTHGVLGEGQVAAESQAAYAGFEDAESLEEYVRKAVDEFTRLENLLFPTRPIA